VSNLKLFVGILAITFAAFYPSLENGFVNWDDDKNFLENPNVRDINEHNVWTQMGRIFSLDFEKSSVIGNYNPLSIATFALEKLFFGFDNPLPWHVNNLLLHIICTLLVFRLMELMKVNRNVGLMITILFAIHPMRVESVAWVTERKDVLFGAFYLGALINYIKYLEKKSKKYLVFIFVLFTLSLLSKIQAVTLPLSMLCIDYWRGRKLGFKLIIEKIPYFTMSLIIGVMGIMALKSQGSLESNSTFEPWQRLFVGCYSYMVYLVKSLVPYKMVPMYPYPEKMPWFMYASMALVPIYLGGFYYAWKKNLKYLVFGLAFFTFNIFFLLQILAAGQGFLADRFTYIAYIGLFFIIAHLLHHLVDRFTPKPSQVFMGIGAVMTIAYSLITFDQSKIWKDSGTLWTHVIKYYPNTTLPWGNRANYYRDSGQLQLALNDYTERIRLDPNKPEPFNSRGKLYFNSTDRSLWPLAKADYERASALEPDNAEYLTNLGAIYAKMGDGNNALSNFSKAITRNPNHAVAYLNRSIIYQQQGNYSGALSDIQTYIKFNPYNPDLWYESVKLKRYLRRPNEAIQDLNTALKYKNTNGLYYYERSRSYYELGNITNARSDYQIAVQKGFKGDANYVNLLK